jgi:beta-N-acetylhexosaminidase
MSLGPLMIDLAGTALTSEDRRLLAHPLVGGVILFSRNFQDTGQLRELVGAIHEVRKPPLLVAVDQEGGRVQRFREGFTRLPPVHVIGRHYDMDCESGTRLAESSGWLMASELLALGIDMSFAPVLDLDWGVSEVIGDRAFHRHPDAVAALGRAYARGMRSAGMEATMKHFPGHGAVVADSHHSLPIDRRPLADLREDMKPFERLIGWGVTSVMMAHIVYSEVDRWPASLSAYWIKQVLRGELDFRGAVFADDLSMEAAALAGDMPQRVRRALAAGCDMVPICNNRAAVLEVVEEMGDEVYPLAQLRLTRLHGRQGSGLEVLRASEQWQQAHALIQGSDRSPRLELDLLDAEGESPS